MLEVIKWLEGLNTPAKQLNAALLLAVGLVGSALVSKEMELREERKERQKVETVIRNQCKAEVAAERKKTEEERQRSEKLQQEVVACKIEQLNFSNDLLAKQQESSSKSEVEDKKQAQLAAKSRIHVRNIQKDAKKLIEVIPKNK